MMDYLAAILNRLLDKYERRGLYDSQPEAKHRSVFIHISKEFPAYLDQYATKDYELLQDAIEHLLAQGLVQGRKDARGYYERLKLQQENIDKCHKVAGRAPLLNTRHTLKGCLDAWNTNGIPLLTKFKCAQQERLCAHHAIEFGIGDDIEKLKDVVAALSGLLTLETETYVRNFSEAVFHDSKHFQKIRSAIIRILCNYGGEELTRENALESFNLLDNPAYINLKGRICLSFGCQTINVAEIPGGLAIPSLALPYIQSVLLSGAGLISVENLTTYHDTASDHNAVLYLGGFHNSIRTTLLQKLYSQNPNKQYFHKGDIDPYGFLILENLREKTGIPFLSMEMDLQTLQFCESRGFIKPLTAADRKTINLPQLQPYQDILCYMKAHNCKTEQESLQAAYLFHD